MTDQVEVPGLITYDGMMWAICKARKPTSCFLSGKAIKPGDQVYRPITNGVNRMNRIRVGAALIREREDR